MPHHFATRHIDAVRFAKPNSVYDMVSYRGYIANHSLKQVYSRIVQAIVDVAFIIVNAGIISCVFGCFRCGQPITYVACSRRKWQHLLAMVCHADCACEERICTVCDNIMLSYRFYGTKQIRNDLFCCTKHPTRLDEADGRF